MSSPPRLWSRAATALMLLAASAMFAIGQHVQAKDRLVLAVQGEPLSGFDPLQGWGSHGHPLFHSTLLKRDAELRLVGDLATDWQLSDDRLSWTIRLRRDAKFSDGVAVTAQDVVFTFEQGRRAGSVLDLTTLASAQVLDDHTVLLRLSEPRISFVSTLATLGIVPRHAYGAHHGRSPVGSGPFRLIAWTPGEQMIAEPNPRYYGARPAFERITFLFTRADATLAAARSGQVDIAAVPNAFATLELPAMRRVVVPTVDNRGILFPMNAVTGATAAGSLIGNDVTADPAIRRALNTGLDRKALVAGVLGGFGSPAWGPADGLPWDEPLQRLPDADAPGARALLEAAGWVDTDGDGIRERRGLKARFTLLYPSTDPTRQALALAAADMARPLGIAIDVAGRSWEDIARLKHSHAVVFGWGAHDPLEVYNLYHSANAGRGFFNAGFYRNPTVDAHLDAAQRAPSLQASLPHWRAAMWDGRTGFGMRGDAAWAWLVNLDHVYFVHDCLDIGARQIEPHGHGFPVTWNLQDWRWTCP